MLYRTATAAVFGAALVSAPLGVAAQETSVTIGTGGQTGVYYVVGQSICRLVNRGAEDHGIKCTAPSTGGSVANLNAISQGEMDMGVAQSDWQYHAYNGTSQFEGNANEDLRAVFSVHPEPFTVVARADSGIETFADLKGKRVNVGNPGSGQRCTMEVVMDRLGWTMDDFALASELKSAEQAQALCDNNVDAIVFTVGHPNGSIKEATTSCEAKLISVEGPEITQLIDENSYYSQTVIPGGMYAGTDEDTTTFGVGATFVSSANTEAETIYQITKAVFDNFDRFKGLHPAFGELEKEQMVTNNLSAPLHDGAKQYFEEAGLLKAGG
ncbi:MAG: TAXI family TRAP transporter solute-binding subunit [Geminicoccaceae bacterium]